MNENADVVAKLANFKKSCFAAPSIKAQFSNSKHWNWQSPEVLDPEISLYSSESEIFSFGTVLNQIFTKYQPYRMVASLQPDKYLYITTEDLTLEQFRNKKLVQQLQASNWVVLDKKTIRREDLKVAELRADIIKKDLRPFIANTIPRAVRQLIHNCWRKDVRDRPKTADLVATLSRELGKEKELQDKNL